ncbi:MAG: NUDIX domain-containing protein [Alphaproteobacteria bacterium]|nr:NUDIX domain-containing protein [Alphaproteobacteria bacterium]MBL6938591.1 NUDIX domain-containing protein [Alphaproteobacteria bacterium]MBL7098052.1 NUDIX domain-containing protein [Alphaproteobacteria bacterium]
MKSRLRQLFEPFVLDTAMTARALLTPVAFGAHAMVFDRNGRVLLARHSYHSVLGFPGGGVAGGEPPEQAVLRELREELGGMRSDPPVLVGLYTRRVGWVTNLIALYRLMNAEVDFRPNLEVREIVFVDPADPPSGIGSGTARRLAEHVSQSPPSPYW